MVNVMAIQKAVADAEIQSPRFRLTPFGKIALSPERNYIARGLIPKEGLTVVWGPPKCGKSFWCFDLAMHVALGWEYRGRRVTQGAVVYAALEGASGFGARAEAFRQAKMAEDGDPPPLYLITDRLDLIREHELLIARIKEQLGATRLVVIFLDTLNRSLVGSESSDEAMAAYIKAADALREAFRCAVVIIHHCGIDATRPRGHTSLAGAVDAQLAVKRDTSANTFSVTVEWMKDGAEGDVIGNQLDVIEVGIDADGEPIKSCVVIEAEATARTASRLNPKQRRAMDALNNLLITQGKPAPNSRDFPPNTSLVPVETWKRELFSAGILDKDASNPRSDFKRLRDKLADKGATRERDGMIWAVARGSEDD